ncbi:MAG: phosphate/phosphite/phosphonate ABC transporter substrate-binding protein [Acidiferrobacterales bacterium]
MNLSIKLFFFMLVAISSATFSLPSFAANEIIFSAPPRGSAEKENKVYKPIAAYLSKVLRKKIIYQHPGNWLSYQHNMQIGKYDLVFDGPHFVSWRILKINHVPLVKLPGKLAFNIIVAKNSEHLKNKHIKSYKDLTGRTVCGLAPPNLATLTLYSLYTNPVRQPLVVEIKSFPDGYAKAIDGTCVGAVMRDKMFNKLNKKKKAGRVIFKSKGITNQAFSAGPRFSAKDKEKLVVALLSKSAAGQMQAFHKRFNKKGKPLLSAKKQDFDGLALLLKDVWGFSLPDI